MEMNDNSFFALLDRIRSAYNKTDFWAKEAKRLYPTISLFRKNIGICLASHNPHA
jgi:hypothetical protein